MSSSGWHRLAPPIKRIRESDFGAGESLGSFAPSECAHAPAELVIHATFTKDAPIHEAKLYWCPACGAMKLGDEWRLPWTRVTALTAPSPR